MSSWNLLAHLWWESYRRTILSTHDGVKTVRSYLCPACTYSFTPFVLKAFAFVINPKWMWLGISFSVFPENLDGNCINLIFVLVDFFLSTLQPEHTSTLVLKNQNQKVPQGPFSTYHTVESRPHSVFHWSGPCLISTDAVYKCTDSSSVMPLLLCLNL